MQETPFLLKTLVGVAWRGCGVSALAGVQNLTGHGPGQPALTRGIGLDG